MKTKISDEFGFKAKKTTKTMVVTFKWHESRDLEILGRRVQKSSLNANSALKNK